MVEPLNKAPRGFTHLLVVVDKFTKWIDAKPITKLMSSKAITLFYDFIYRFGVPNSIVTNNGTQLTGEPFLRFCDNSNIHVD